MSSTRWKAHFLIQLSYAKDNDSNHFQVLPDVKYICWTPLNQFCALVLSSVLGLQKSIVEKEHKGAASPNISNS